MNYQSYAQMQSSQYVQKIIRPENNVQLKTVQRLETKTSVLFLLFLS